MKMLLAITLMLPMFVLSGCSGKSEVPALNKPGVDPPADQQKKWMEESLKHGSAPKGYKPPKADADAAGEKK